MFNVNDYVSYGLNGICHIQDIRKEVDKETDYYILKPISNDKMTIMVPVNNTNILMRATMSKEAVLSLIDAMPEIEAVWIADNKERNANFKTAIRSGRPEEWIRVLKAIHHEKEARLTNGKKITKSDEDFMQTAEQILNEEFAFALNISPDQVVAYICERIPARVI
ncbi:MAG: CarD family transcriptional regulator [Syntrophomonas sp.]|nr:CarD family transcriptional regulator [Syntrophomonas sp.]